jgi:D-glycero-D-manno-heptose 1,7-bisphosphate phosphatase
VADPAVFLDRDGTLIEEVGYPTHPEQIRILGGVARALGRLSAAGYKLVVVTNQSAIARGLMSEDDLHRFHQALDDQLDLLGARVDAYYACPHHPEASQAERPDLAIDCDCRKPKPGLILRAAKDLDIDMARSWLVGDTWRDIAAGQAAGLRTVKLPTGDPRDGPRPDDLAPPTAEAPGLDEAAVIILAAPEVAPQMAEAETRAPEAPAAEPQAAAPLEEPASAPALAEAEEADLADAPVAESPQAAPEPAPAPEPKEEPVIAPQKVPAADAVRGPCARCGRDVSESDLVSGAAGEHDGFLFCGECLARQPRGGEETVPENTADLLRSMLVELRRLSRTRPGSSFTFLRLLAYLVQAGALFCGLVLGLVSDDRATYLQIAILLQLLVVSILLLERNS